MKHSRGRGRRRKTQTAVSLLYRSVAFITVLVGILAGLRFLSKPVQHVVSNDVIIKKSIPLPSPFSGTPAQSARRRVVYPYSVIPGGVASADELKEVAGHDPVVAQHYAGFDYKRARLAEVTGPRLVYLSYRRGEKIFWTRKQVSLHQGEKLLTDGHTSARTRCGNQVSVLPQANTSPDEPSVAELDQPDSAASGMNMAMPASFQSKLLEVDPAMPIDPGSSSHGSNWFAGGRPPAGFMPMPIGGGGIGSTGKLPQTCAPGDPSTACNPNSPNTPPTPPAPVPEPGTILFVASGAAAIWAKMRKKK